MSMPRKVTIQQMAPMLQKFMLSLKHPGATDIYECKTRDEIITVSEEYPLEIMSIPNRTPSSTGMGTIVGYFMVGVAFPAYGNDGVPIDSVKRPVFAYYYLNEHDWREMNNGIKKEVEIRKVRLAKERSQWKDLGNAQSF